MNIVILTVISILVGFIAGYKVGSPTELFWQDVEEELREIKGVGNTTARRIKDYLKKQV